MEKTWKKRENDKRERMKKREDKVVEGEVLQEPEGPVAEEALQVVPPLLQVGACRLLGGGVRWGGVGWNGVG